MGTSPIKTIKISEAARATAKRKAKACGMLMQRFVEQAIEAFEPRIESGLPHRRKRIAG